MLEDKAIKIQSKRDPDVVLKVIPGHFATTQSHITHYMDMTTMKTRCKEAQKIAELMAMKYSVSTPVDTIVCMEGLQVIGAYLAEDLAKAGVLSMNAHKTIYVVTPEFSAAGQMIFRDNLKPMITGKNIIFLEGSITTGKTLLTCARSIDYYGGKLQGVSAIFSAVSKMGDLDVNAIYSRSDIPHYESYRQEDCPLCKQKIKLDALVNSYGYSVL